MATCGWRPLLLAAAGLAVAAGFGAAAHGEVVAAVAAAAGAAQPGDGAAGARKVGPRTPTGRSRSGSVQCCCALESGG